MLRCFLPFGRGLETLFTKSKVSFKTDLPLRSAQSGFKMLDCYHIMAVAVHERLLQIPLRYMTAEIAAKAKRGRKRRAVGGEALVNPEEANKQKGRAAKKSRKSTSEAKTKQTKKQMLNKLSKK